MQQQQPIALQVVYQPQPQQKPGSAVLRHASSPVSVPPQAPQMPQYSQLPRTPGSPTPASPVNVGVPQPGAPAVVGGVASEPCSQMTSEKVHVAKDYMRKYYEKVLHDESNFVMEHSRARSKRISIHDFELLGLIGRGAFGEVRLAYRKDDPTQTIVALKTLRKDYMIKKKQVLHVRAERELLVEARSHASFSNQWVVELYCTFQDERHLYFVMEYCPGGDMMGWLIKQDIFAEQVARFYIAELIAAVDSLHRMNYAHRDLKPDNILLDRSGHIKLTDFGLCKQAVREAEEVEGSPMAAVPGTPLPSHLGTTDERRQTWQRMRQQRELFYTTVGSPGYIAPEVLAKRGYGMECDFWSVGIILYEMLCGYPPFFSEEGITVEQKILRWRTYLEFPTGREALSPLAEDLIRGLLCEAKDRLTLPQIQRHPFFSGVDWANLRSQSAPFRIELSSPTDRRYFDAIPEETPVAANKRPNAGREEGEVAADSRYLFYGFTSKFNQQGQVSRNTMKRSVRPGIPSFDE